jgi:hypothetical protein
LAVSPESLSDGSRRVANGKFRENGVPGRRLESRTALPETVRSAVENAKETREAVQVNSAKLAGRDVYIVTSFTQDGNPYLKTHNDYEVSIFTREGQHVKTFGQDVRFPRDRDS